MRSEVALSVIIPVYRSEAYLARTIAELVAYLEPRVTFEIVLVNDGSPDGVQRVIDNICGADPRIRCTTLGRNVGQHRATLIGFARARGNVVVTVDDDGQNPPSAALAVAEALQREDLDVVYGRFGSVEQSGFRRVASWLNRKLSRLTIGNVRDVSITNVRALRGDLARLLGNHESAYPYIDALVFRATRSIGEVPVEHRAREQGASTYRLRTLLRLSLSHLTTLTVLPLKLAMLGSFGVSALGLAIGLVEMVRALVKHKAPAGWLSLFVALTFLFSILFAFLGIVSAYVGRMYVAVNERGLVWVRPTPRADSTAESGDLEHASRRVAR